LFLLRLPGANAVRLFARVKPDAIIREGRGQIVC